MSPWRDVVRAGSRFVALAATGVVAGCGSAEVRSVVVDIPARPQVVARVDIAAGDTTALVAGAWSGGYPPRVLYDSRTYPDRFAWRSTNEAVATVDTRGTLRAVAPGSAAVVASSGGSSSDAVPVRVFRRPLRIRITPESATAVVGESIAFHVAALDSGGAVLPDVPVFAWLVPADGHEITMSAGVVPLGARDIALSATEPGVYRVRAVVPAVHLDHVVTAEATLTVHR